MNCVIIMQPFLGGRNKRCTLSVCLSVSHMPPIFLKQESSRNF